MKIDIVKEIDKDSFRLRLRRYTWQAFGAIPVITQPRILDLGCGTGIVSIELAVLSKGIIHAVDKDGSTLSLLREKIKGLNLSGNIKTIKCGFDKLKLRSEFYDIIWSEGAINAIGFETGIQSWRKFLKTGGYMVIHDEINDYKKKLSVVSNYGYELLKYFIIGPDIWLRDYFKPLEERIIALKNKYAQSSEIIDLLKEEETEIEQFKSNPMQFASIFYVMRKTR
jgi:cyclopropane fatty-acyl-phospholipid synthase-like methyltransferase